MKYILVRRLVHGNSQNFDFLSLWNPITEEHQFNLIDHIDGLSFTLSRIIDEHPLYKECVLESQFQPFLFKNLVDAKKALNIVKLCYIENNPMVSYGMCILDKITSIEYYIVSVKTEWIEVPKKVLDFNSSYIENP